MSKRFLRVLLLLVFGFVILLFAIGKIEPWNKQPLYLSDEIRTMNISHASGFYDEPFFLELTAVGNYEIRYTLDGSEPSVLSPLFQDSLYIQDVSSNENVYSARTDLSIALYTGAENPPDFPVDKCTVLRAATFTPNGRKVEEAVFTYFVGFQNKNGYDNMNFISIVTDPKNLFDERTGIYVLGEKYINRSASGEAGNQPLANYLQHGKEWEREAYASFFDSEGRLQLQQEIGIRIHGNVTRENTKKSLNLYVRDDIGNHHFSTFREDLLQTGYLTSSYTLSSGGNDPNLIKDRLAAKLTKDLNYANTVCEPYVLFLDGEYWGVYYLTERYDERYYSYHYHIDPKDLVTVKLGALDHGEGNDLEDWKTAMFFLVDWDLQDEDKYSQVCELIDMDSLLDYFATNIYLCNTDCMEHLEQNVEMWRCRKPYNTTDERDGRWRFSLFDLNYPQAMEDTGYSMLNHLLNVQENEFYISLSENEGFNRALHDRLDRISQDCFSPEKADSALDQICQEMYDAISLDAQRYGRPCDSFEEEAASIHSFFSARREAVLEDFAR